MKKKILSEVTISCDPPCVPYYIQNKGPEAVADYYESWIREFDEFIRDLCCQYRKIGLSKSDLRFMLELFISDQLDEADTMEQNWHIS